MTKLEEGMLLLTTEKVLSIYAVADKSGKVLVQHLGLFSVKKTLKKPYLPEGWKILNNGELSLLAAKD